MRGARALLHAARSNQSHNKAECKKEHHRQKQHHDDLTEPFGQAQSTQKRRNAKGCRRTHQYVAPGTDALGGRSTLGSRRLSLLLTRSSLIKARRRSLGSSLLERGRGASERRAAAKTLGGIGIHRGRHKNHGNGQNGQKIFHCQPFKMRSIFCLN